RFSRDWSSDVCSSDLNLSGPITIAKVAGASAAGGIEAFVGFLALLSVSLAVLNLLPVPVLDGGHILFCAAEIVRGKPLPERVQKIGRASCRERGRRAG